MIRNVGLRHGYNILKAVQHDYMADVKIANINNKLCYHDVRYNKNTFPSQVENPHGRLMLIVRPYPCQYLTMTMMLSDINTLNQTQYSFLVQVVHLLING